MKILSVLCCGCCLLLARGAMARSTDGAREEVAIAGNSVEERIEFIQSRLDGHKTSARRWWGGWLVGYGLLAAVQGGAAAFGGEEGLKKDAMVGGAGSLFGFTATLLRPIDIRWAGDELRSGPGETAAQRSLKLQRAERFLEAASAEEELAGSWLAHSAALSVPTASALTLWLVYDRPGPAVLNFVAGVLIGQVQIRTYPGGATDDWNEYLVLSSTGRRTALPAKCAVTWRVMPRMAPGEIAMGFFADY